MFVTLISVLVSFFWSVEDMHIMTKTLSHPISTFPAEVERAVVCPCFGSHRDDQRVGLIGSRGAAHDPAAGPDGWGLDLKRHTCW